MSVFSFVETKEELRQVVKERILHYNNNQRSYSFSMKWLKSPKAIKETLQSISDFFGLGKIKSFNRAGGLTLSVWHLLQFNLYRHIEELKERYKIYWKLGLDEFKLP